MKKQQGFTLIELMIVVAVIGVLAAIAVPQYQKYVGKSEASSALASITGLRTNIETHILDDGTFPATTDVAPPSSALGAITYESVSSAAGTVQFEFNSSGVSPETISKKVQLIRDSSGTWECKSDVADDIKPKGCTAI
ncbi:prepilin-type cleavage/methylation domain-containing protein [Photobacterium angustum]|uniref:pilin n=1 Tax=Photobacterium angustum TaxID=661 RepID=UPI0005DCB39A|nr:pilin [Photobacterium angustum]KJG29611.1 fimbrial protein [Photobacterium angustum]PSW89193.1 prepilin-type cleavage/methylation domain-containing protein [Photobacterium angustum]